MTARKKKTVPTTPRSQQNTQERHPLIVFGRDGEMRLFSSTFSLRQLFQQQKLCEDALCEVLR